jgi:hypothetical protein
MTRTGGRRDTLDDLAALGPFFTVCTHPAGAEPRPPWRPLRELAGPGGPLPARIDAVRAALAARAGRPAGEIEPRVAASITHLGLAARLIGPALAAAATGRRLGMRLGELWWQDTLGGPVPLSVPVPLPAATADDPAATQGLLNEVIAPLTAETSRLVTVSPRVLWGNVASAVNGAAAQVTARRPDLSRPAWAVAAALFATPQLSRERQPPGPAFRRSSCCLIYKITAGGPQGVCGDCVLRLRVSADRRSMSGGEGAGAR